MKNFIVMIATIWFTACASPAPHSVMELTDEKTETKGKGADLGSKITLNEKNQVQIEVENSVEFELQVQDLRNSHLQDEIVGELFNLKACRVSMADPALGGSGEVAALPDIDTGRVGYRDGEQAFTEEMGLSKDGDLKIVRKQFLDERLKAERKWTAETEKKIKAIKPMREECERKLNYKQRELANVKVAE